jgi:hypothetical protein
LRLYIGKSIPFSMTRPSKTSSSSGIRWAIIALRRCLIDTVGKQPTKTLQTIVPAGARGLLYARGLL